jgi:predicted acetyltransferase
MLQDLRIRNVKADDIDWLLTMGADCEGFQVAPNIGFWHKEILQNWLQQIDNDIFLIAEIRNQPVGFLFVTIHPVLKKATLENVFVLPRHRNLAIVRALLKRCFSILQRRRIKFVHALTKIPTDKLKPIAKRYNIIVGYQFTWILFEVN